MALTDNLVAFWKLDESSGNAADSVGSFTLTNRGTTTYTAGLINNGADFGSANTTKALNTSNTLGIDGGAMSISLWVKLNTEIPSGTWSLAVQQNLTSTKTGYWFRYYYNSGTPYLEWERWRNNSADQRGTYTVSLGTSTWHHLVITYDTTTVKGYLDGVERASFSASGSGSGSPGGSSGFAIASDDGVAVSTAGSFVADATGVWTRALTSGEVTTLYSGGNGTQHPFTAFPMTAATGSFALTGVDAALSRTYMLIAEIGSFILTGIDASLRVIGWVNRSRPTSTWTDVTRSDQ